MESNKPMIIGENLIEEYLQRKVNITLKQRKKIELYLAKKFNIKLD